MDYPEPRLLEEIQSNFHEIASSLTESHLNRPMGLRFPNKLVLSTSRIHNNYLKFSAFSVHKLSRVELESSFIPLKLESGFSKSLFIRTSLNGFIIIDTQNNLVAKALKWEFEPNFIKNQISAVTICSSIAENIIRTLRFEDFDILISAYFPMSWNYPASAWPFVFPRVMKAVLQNQLESDSEPLGDQKPDFRINLSFSANKKEFQSYDLQFHELENKIDTLFQSRDFFGIEPNSVRLVFAHGDLMPSNLLEIKSQPPVLIDWVNGGFHNLFYDLVIQEIYNSNSEAWVNFFQNSLRDIEKKGLYSNGLSTYKNIHQEYIGRSLTIDNLNHGALTSLKEFALKNYLRHRNSVNLDEGVKVIKGVSEIIERIENSRVSRA